jgi:ubiquinone/menaquinone biosynthesis C-methylase UbiE
MGLIFDQKSAAVFEEWHRSSQGQAVDAALSRLILQLVEPIAGERVLDIGCGTGHHMLMLSKLGLDVTGLDASPCMIKKAEERLGHRCLVKKGEAEDLPFDDNEFDAAFLIHTLEYLENPVEALREAGRVARKKVFVGVCNGLSWHGVSMKLQGYMGNPLFARARFYNVWGLRRLLQEVYGDVPIVWQCIGSRTRVRGDSGLVAGESGIWDGSPFGPFLGMAASMRYTHRTQPLPLTIGIKKARGSLVRPAVGMEDIKTEQRGYPS